MSSLPRPGLLRRFGAILYDSLAAFSVLFVADALVVIPLQGIWGIDLVGRHPLFQVYQVLIVGGFFCGFWTHGGQTLGLRAWRLRVVREDGGPLRWSDALKRFVAAVLSWLPAGLGFLWAVIDRDGLAWHDRLSRTRLEFVQE
jgi:uncharacterized RDD family membrane protein YckC